MSRVLKTNKEIKLDRGELLNPSEVAVLLGLSRDRVLRHLRQKRLPGFKFGKQWLVRRCNLERFLAMKEAWMEKKEDESE